MKLRYKKVGSTWYCWEDTEMVYVYGMGSTQREAREQLSRKLHRMEQSCSVALKQFEARFKKLHRKYPHLNSLELAQKYRDLQ